MIKRLIFDVDDTLIPWEDKYWNSLKDALIYFGIEPTEELFNKLKEAVDNYEIEYNKYNMDTMQQIMEKYTNTKLPIGFVKRWTIELEKCVPEKYDDKLIETLEYLSSKYDLVVLTNWFTNQQSMRMKNFGILNYFSEVIGTEEILNKPNKEAFLKACSPYSVDECIFIGDSLETDIKGALNTGLHAIHLTSKEKGENIINSLYELRNIL